MTPEEALRVPSLIPLKFWTEYEGVENRPVDWVKLAKKGSNGMTRDEKVARVQKHEPAVWEIVGKAYDHWKKGQEEPVDGTPLSAWPGVNSAMADKLKLIHLRTVEDVANTTETDFERIGMGARELRDKARAFVKAREGQAAIAEAMAGKDRQISDLAAQVAELTKTVEQLAAGKPKREKPGDFKNQAA